jgi:hypothetical protein
MLAAIFTCAAGSAYAQEHRQLGAHEHGHGRLNIAIEDKTLSMELEVPGADIVGFEHEPSTPEQKAALERAKAKLENGLSLFTPSPAAGCIQKSAKVSTEAEHGDEHEHQAAHGSEKEEEHHHSEFHVEYSLECASLSRLASMTFDYFKAFPGAQELDITLISPKGQTSYEVTRAKPALELAGIM